MSGLEVDSPSRSRLTETGWNPPMRGEIEAMKALYEKELFGSVVPFWEKHSIDHKVGGYFNSLDRDGAVFDGEKHMWMQWRSVYMFSELAHSPYGEKKWVKFARHGADFLMQHGRDEKGNYFFALNAAGEPSVSACNIYSDAFAALGSAALFRASGIRKYRDEAARAYQNYLWRMQDPKGRWDKSMPGRQKRHTLGYFMILANLGHVMNECLATSEYDADLDRSARTVIDHFWNEEEKTLFENINADGSFDLESAEGRRLNPGHGLESMWFLMQVAEKKSDSQMLRRLSEMTLRILETGWDETCGGMFYFRDARGRPSEDLTWDMKLWWVHCEALVASLYAFQVSRDPRFWKWFKKIHDWSFAHFPDPEHGEWFAYLNRRGEATHLLKGGKWKCFFHLPRALLQCLELFKRIPA